MKSKYLLKHASIDTRAITAPLPRQQVFQSQMEIKKTNKIYLAVKQHLWIIKHVMLINVRRLKNGEH